MTRIAAHLSTLSDDDGAVILDVRGNRFITLNATGRFIWTRLEDGNTAGAIVEELSRVSGVDSQTLGIELDDFLNQLKCLGVLET